MWRSSRAHRARHLLVVELGRGLQAGAPQEAAQQHVPGRGPAGELAGAPGGGHHRPALGARHHEAEALEVVPHLVGAVGHRHRRRGDVVDRRQLRGRPGRHRAQQLAAGPGRCGQHHGVGGHALAAGQLHGVGRARRLLREGRDGHAAVQALGRQRGHHGVAQVCRPVRNE